METPVAEPTSPVSSEVQSPAPVSFFVWFPVALATSALLGAAAAHAPARVKLLLLFSLALGILTGTVLARAGRQFQIVASKSHWVALGFCILVGQVAAAAEAYRVHLNFWDDHFRSVPLTGRLSEFTPEQIAKMSPESREVAEQIRQEVANRRELRTFAGYLQHRRPDGMTAWPVVATTLWWVVEILAATAAGMVTASRMLHPQTSPTELAATRPSQ